MVLYLGWTELYEYQELREEVGRSDQRLKELLYQQPFFQDLSDDALGELVYQSRVSSEAG